MQQKLDDLDDYDGAYSSQLRQWDILREIVTDHGYSVRDLQRRCDSLELSRWLLILFDCAVLIVFLIKCLF